MAVLHRPQPSAMTFILERFAATSLLAVKSSRLAGSWKPGASRSGSSSLRLVSRILQDVDLVSAVGSTICLKNLPVSLSMLGFQTLELSFFFPSLGGKSVNKES